jgi:hypothetical protein
VQKKDEKDTDDECRLGTVVQQKKDEKDTDDECRLEKMHHAGARISTAD